MKWCGAPIRLLGWTICDEGKQKSENHTFMANLHGNFTRKSKNKHLIITAIYLEFFFLSQIFNSKEVVAVVLLDILNGFWALSQKKALL